MSQPQRSQELEALFGAGVAARLAWIGEESPPLDAAEEPAAASMGSGRRSEFAFGRACAREALAQLGVTSGIPRHDDRSPIWPDTITGSISHSRGLCAAVAATRTSAQRAIGLDLELVDRLSAGVERRILTEEERRVVAGLGDGPERQERTAIVFAAKEAFYKAQYQLTRTWLPFSAVSVVLGDGATLHVEVGDGTADSGIVASTAGRWCRLGQHVAAAMTVGPHI